MTVANLPTTMTIVQARQPGGPDVLEPATRAVPAPGSGEVLVKVAAAGVNRPDLMQRLGKYPPPQGASDVLGLELSGVIVALGPNVSRWRAGDRITALVAGGGYAEFAIVPEPQCLPVPRGLSMEEAAALPETFFTVWTNVFERGHLQAGETLLVHGGASGIGTTAIQLARARGARVFATSGSRENCLACERLGAERAINYRTDDFVATVLDATMGRGVDMVLDMVGGDYVSRNLEVLAMDGRLLQIAFLHGPHSDVNLSPLMRKRITFTGSTLRPRTVEEKGAIARALEREVWPLIESGDVRPVLHAVFPLSEASVAHAELEAGHHVGKIVLRT
jgi:putative PIG3 family NAD(P)H quinone oxidoreductase